jgi:uncharacterized protein (DUF169 family)
MKWSEVSDELTNLLRLKTDPVAFKRLEKAAELDTIKNVYRVPHLCSFCQVLFMARIQRLTVGVTRTDKLNDRCMRIHGVKSATEKSMNAEAALLSTTWFATPQEAAAQLKDTSRVPAGEAVVVAPLGKEKFEPEVILVFGNPAQLMMLLCGLQKEKYERFDFSFVGEGSCSDSLARCYNTKKPSLSIPCFGERSMGQVADDELIVAVPPEEMGRAVSGIKKLGKIGFKYPIAFIGGLTDLEPIMRQIYPAAFQKPAAK